MFPEICMVGAKVIQFSAKYFGACFELLTKGGWIKPLYRQARGGLKIQRLNTRQVELHPSKQHSANFICKACSTPIRFVWYKLTLTSSGNFTIIHYKPVYISHT